MKKECDNLLFKNLETERLYLKNIDSIDREFIFSHFSNDEVNRYLYDAEPLTDIAEADEIIEFYTKPEPRNQCRWIIIRKSDNKRLGTCGFHCWDKKLGKVEIGYDLNEEFWGNGYMHEAIKEIIKFAKNQMHINKIDACISTENQKSMRLAENLGFVLSDSSMVVFREKGYPHNIYSLHY
jgi:ribosomal-protein-alanine N-acetyltransferase